MTLPADGHQKHFAHISADEPILDTVEHLTVDDVLLTRGPTITSHPGNLRFDILMLTRAHEFNATLQCPIKERIAGEILQEIERRGGRFLRRIDPVLDDIQEDRQLNYNNKMWVVVQKDVALDKIKQALQRMCQPDHSLLKQEGSSRPFISCSPTLYIDAPAATMKPVHSSKLVVVTDLASNDVLMSRGTTTKDHRGNAHFYDLLRSRMHEFKRTWQRPIKVRIAREILQEIHRRNGRFLRPVAPMLDQRASYHHREWATSAWFEMDDDEAVEKIMGALKGADATSPSDHIMPRQRHSFRPIGTTWLAITTTLTSNDVVLGQGACDTHPGNKRFNQLLRAFKGNSTVTWIAREIRHEVRRWEGRFLRCIDPKSDCIPHVWMSKAWVLMEDEEATEIIKQQVKAKYAQWEVDVLQTIPASHPCPQTLSLVNVLYKPPFLTASPAELSVPTLASSFCTNVAAGEEEPVVAPTPELLSLLATVATKVAAAAAAYSRSQSGPSTVPATCLQSPLEQLPMESSQGLPLSGSIWTMTQELSSTNTKDNAPREKRPLFNSLQSINHATNNSRMAATGVEATSLDKIARDCGDTIDTMADRLAQLHPQPVVAEQSVLVTASDCYNSATPTTVNEPTDPTSRHFSKRPRIATVYEL